MPTPSRLGLLIAFEGIDGAGKSTQIARLAQALRAAGATVVTTREPTQGPWGQRLRDSATTGRLSPEDELALFIQDRTEHVATLIRPALERGDVVLVDRYYYSSMAYQGARGLDPEAIRVANEAIAPRPDRVVLIEVPVEAGLARVRSRGAAADLFEREDALRRVTAIFQGLQGDHILRFDGTQDVDTLAEQIRAAVLPLLG